MNAAVPPTDAPREQRGSRSVFLTHLLQTLECHTLLGLPSVVGGGKRCRLWTRGNKSASFDCNRLLQNQLNRKIHSVTTNKKRLNDKKAKVREQHLSWKTTSWTRMTWNDFYSSSVTLYNKICGHFYPNLLSQSITKWRRHRNQSARI